MGLPPRYDPAATCEKCGGRPRVAFHTHSDRFPPDDLPFSRYPWCAADALQGRFVHELDEDVRYGEHLHLTCRRCGYQWPALPVDLTSEEIADAMGDPGA